MSFRATLQWAILSAAFGSATCLPGAAQCRAPEQGNSDPNDSEQTQVAQTLEAMKNASTRGHPDLFGMTVSMRRYADHQYRAALHYFEIGAPSLLQGGPTSCRS